VKDEAINKYRRWFGFSYHPHIQSMLKECTKQQRGENDACNRETKQASTSCLALGIDI